MILITGASKGIGKYLFDRFKQDGYDAIGTYNSTNSTDVRLTEVDVANYQSVANWIAKHEAELSEIVLVNCAGITDASFLHKSDPQAWVKVINTNLIGSYNVIRNVLPIMRRQRYGRIINFSSVVSKLPTPGISAYAASKSALIGLTKTLAVENGALGITANALCLGYVEAGMGVNDVSEQYRNKVMERIPVGRFCEPEEIYGTLLWIIGNQYVNGSAIDINGGII